MRPSAKRTLPGGMGSVRVLLMLIADQPHLVDEAIRAALEGKPAGPAEPRPEGGLFLRPQD